MWLKSKIFLSVVLFYTDFFGQLEALKSSEDGVCIVQMSVRKTRIKMVPITRMCGKKRCMVKKVEQYNVPESRTLCCKGWEYDISSDACSPVCSTGCVGGRCISPEICHCDPPAYLDPEHNNACLQPICDPPCVHADCETNNTCSCHPGHSRFNSTHCLLCDPGYTIDQAYKCTPVCEEKCINGTCSEPNKCTCLEGYQSVRENMCELKCDSCINSTCVAPNVCSCLEGYTKLNESTCVPSCESCDGECVAPEVCIIICRSGYNSIGGVCKPTCENCENGVCTAPGECTCNEGFVADNSDPSTCVSSCYKPKEVEESVQKIRYISLKKCPKGTDCTKKESAEHPSKRGFKCCRKTENKKEKRLKCCAGWEYHDKTCRATCRLGCTNGRCIAPDVCECEGPLMLVNKNQCVQPVCDTPCFNGQCIANNTCECNPGFITHNKTHCASKCESGYTNDVLTLDCVPKCDSPCMNGTCTGPNNCTCTEGFTPKDKFVCVPECTPSCDVNSECVAPNSCSCFTGYRFNNSSSVCVPECDDCENGDCTLPSVCKCHDGYNMTDGRCKPVCEQLCKNGICSAPNVCQCDNDYEINHKNKFECVPICDPICVNASCASPDTCVCFSGYEIGESSSNCRPTCKDCKNGECVAPDECRCHEGYAKMNGTCEAVCDQPCTNGVCSEPSFCTCNAGYRLNGTNKFSCEPVCDQTCVNATCTSPNTCSCHSGYGLTEDKFVCKPKCMSCNHGECVAPDECKCHEGYNKTDGQCSPICAIPCINANCTSPNNCTCRDGYEKQFHSVCHRPCLNPCDHGVCSLHGICRCDLGYQLFNDTCTLIPPVDCNTCDKNCSSSGCWCADGRPCEDIAVESEMSGDTSSTSIAGLELSWTLGGAVVLLLVILVIVVMQRIYRRRKEFGVKDVHDMHIDHYGSVVYTVPDTLLQRNDIDDHDNDKDNDDSDHNDTDGDVTKIDRLLTPECVIQDQKL